MKKYADTTCPNCHNDHLVEFDVPDVSEARNQLAVIEKPLQAPDLDAAIERAFAKRDSQAQAMQKEKEKKAAAKKKDDPIFPSFLPGAPCLSGNCSQGGYHKNPGYKDKLNKRCANCETLNGTSAKRCFACKSQEFYDDLLSDEELRDLGIDLPEDRALEMHAGHVHNHDHDAEEEE